MTPGGEAGKVKPPKCIQIHRPFSVLFIFFSVGPSKTPTCFDPFPPVKYTGSRPKGGGNGRVGGWVAISGVT